MRILARVQPAASRDEILWQADQLLIRVAAPAGDGRANDRVVVLLAKRLGLPKSGVRVVRGRRSREKLLEIEGLEMLDMQRRIGGEE